jgi:hypothetical protein
MGYEKGQIMRMSQGYDRCRNGKGRLKQKWVGGVGRGLYKKVEEKRKSLVHGKIINSDKIRTRIF